MAEPYSITIQGETADLVLAQASRFAWREVERRERRGLTPWQLAYFTVELTLQGVEILGGTPAAVVTALQTALTRTVHRAAQPTYVQIKDSGGTVVPEVGEINTTANAWEDLAVTAVTLEAIDSPEQLVALARFDLVIRATRVFADENGVVLLEAERTVGADEDGLRFRRREGEVRMAAGVDVATVADQLRLPLPEGWRRSIGNDPTTGVEISYTEDPLVHKATFVSEVRELQFGLTTPASQGGGFASRSEEEQLDPALGITRTRVTLRQEGTDDPRSYVEGEIASGAVYVVTDEGASAQAVWETLQGNDAPEGYAPQVTKVRASYSIVGGGRPADVLVMGGAPAVVREGQPFPARIVEDKTVFGVGFGEVMRSGVPLAQFFSPPGTALHELYPEEFVEDGAPRLLAPPRVHEPRGSEAQHLWTAVVRREYLYVGAGEVLESTSLAEAVSKGEL